MSICIIVTLTILFYNFCGCQQIVNVNEYLEISVVHFNDFHARFEETDVYGNTCKNGSKCIGGFSRLYSQIHGIKAEKPDVLVLNAGDSFQGTLWYTVGKWNVTQEFMNKLPVDAEVLGNHDFDNGISGVLPYIKSLQHPIVACNIDNSLEPTFKGTYNKSTIVVRNGLKIGIIGVIIQNCDQLANTGKLKFLPESASVNEEAERLVKEEGVFTNIILSHSGYATDLLIAKNASEKISLIVGGHSHSFLYTGENPPGIDAVRGDYPTIVESKHGRKVLVVQASAFAKYLGNITLLLDGNGEVADFSGAPVYLDTDLPQDASINAQLQPWKEIVDTQGPKKVGSTTTLLSQTSCYNAECSLGNLVADSMVYAYTKYRVNESWTEAALAMTNPGGLRANIGIGDITYNDLATAQPFGNTFDLIDIKGKHLKELFEFTSTRYSSGTDSRLNILQLSGFQIEYDLTRADGDRVKSIKVRCQKCLVPKYEQLDNDSLYTVVANSFMLKENSRYGVLSRNAENRRVGAVDIDVIVEFLQHRSPVFMEVGNRINFV